jgi:hypothetical protein
MTFLFKYKSNPAHRRRSKRAHIKKVQLQVFNLLDHPSCYFGTTVEREDEWDSVKLLTLPQKAISYQIYRLSRWRDGASCFSVWGWCPKGRVHA